MTIKDFVNNYDPQNQFAVLKESFKQIEFAWNNIVDLSKIKSREFDAIVITGMGGSAISGDLLKEIFNDEIQIPLFVVRNYSLPSFVNNKTLVIISSYSGNTEESVSCFKDALKRKSSIAAISTGGKVEQIALTEQIPRIELQKGFQPRYALGMSFFTLVKVFQSLKIIPGQESFVESVTKLWKEKAELYSKENNYALNIADELIGYIPIIYSCSGITSAAGYRMKCQFNENSKLHAFHNSIPELDHNEIIGWETFRDNQLNAKIINILDDDYPPQIRKRFDITTELAGRKGVDAITLMSSEKNRKVRIMDLIYLGDWITYYLAVLRGFDPSEIEYIYELKKRLA